MVIEGPSGSGKSDLALRLIDRGAVLVSDDCTLLVRIGQCLHARSPERMAGRMEIRGLGILSFDHVDSVPVELFLRLSQTVERLPQTGYRTIAGIQVRELPVNAMSNSAAIIVELAVRGCGRTLPV